MSDSTLNSLVAIPTNSRFKALELKKRKSGVERMRENYLRIAKDRRSEQLNTYRDLDNTATNYQPRDEVIVASEADHISETSVVGVQPNYNSDNQNQNQNQNQRLLDHLAKVETEIHQNLINKAVEARLISRDAETILLINPEGQYVLALPDGQIIMSAAENVFRRSQAINSSGRLMIMDDQTRGFEIREEKSDNHITVKDELSLNNSRELDVIARIPAGENFEEMKSKIEKDYELIESNRSSVEKSVHDYLVKQAINSGAIREGDETILKSVDGQYYLEKPRDDLIDQLPNRVEILDDIGGTAIYSYEPDENINVINLDENKNGIIEFQQTKDEGVNIKADRTYINAIEDKPIRTIGDEGFITTLNDSDSSRYNSVDFDDESIRVKTLADIRQVIRNQREEINRYESRNRRRTKNKTDS